MTLSSRPVSNPVSVTQPIDKGSDLPTDGSSTSSLPTTPVANPVSPTNPVDKPGGTATTTTPSPQPTLPGSKRPIAHPVHPIKPISELIAQFATTPQANPSTPIAPIQVPGTDISAPFPVRPITPIYDLPQLPSATPPGPIIVPIDVRLFDLTLTTYDGAATLATNLQAFDQHMNDAALNEQLSYTAADDLSGQNITLGQSVADASTASTAFDQDQFTGDLGIYINQMSVTDPIVSQASDAQASAEQPLTTLQGDQNPAPPPSLPQSLDEFISEQPEWPDWTPDVQQQAIVNFCAQYPQLGWCAPYLQES